MKCTTRLLGAVSATALIAMSSTPAFAVGTTAGDSITNEVSVSFEVGGELQTPVEDTDTFVVDRKIDVNVNFTGATPVSVSPGQDQAALAFDVTNLSNTVVDLDLTTVLTGGTVANIDNFEIYLDSDGDGTLDAGEIAAGPITFLDAVAADDGLGAETISVVVVADIDLAATNGDTFDVVLVADAHESGAVGDGALGAEITATAGANTAGVDTVLADGNGGTGEEADNDGAFSDEGQFAVAGAIVSVVKSSRIISDPVNNTLDGTGVDPNAKAIPGAVIEYCIAVSNAAGGATATNINVTDDLPADVTFTVSDPIFVDADGDCADGVNENVVGGDASYSAGTGPSGENQVLGTLADIPASTTRSLYFRVTIN